MLRFVLPLGGGRSAPPRISQGMSTGVVQGISMPLYGVWESRQSYPCPEGVDNSVVNPVGFPGRFGGSV